MKNRFMNEFWKLCVFQLGFVVAIFVSLSVLRYFNAPLVNEIIGVFDEYVNTEVSLSLVLDGI